MLISKVFRYIISYYVHINMITLYFWRIQICSWIRRYCMKYLSIFSNNVCNQIWELCLSSWEIRKYNAPNDPSSFHCFKVYHDYIYSQQLMSMITSQEGYCVAAVARKVKNKNIESESESDYASNWLLHHSNVSNIQSLIWA